MATVNSLTDITGAMEKPQCALTYILFLPNILREKMCDGSPSAAGGEMNALIGVDS